MHPADQEAGDRVALDAVQTEVGEDPVDAEPIHGGTASVFHTHGARPGELQ
jgi:hypothetical protein